MTKLTLGILAAIGTVVSLPAAVAVVNAVSAPCAGGCPWGG